MGKKVCFFIHSVNRVRMKKKTSPSDEFSQEERLLMEGLRRCPEMMARVQSIVEIARNEGALKTADEVEELLVEEMRKLGNTAMRDWASAAQERVSEEWRGLPIGSGMIESGHRHVLQARLKKAGAAWLVSSADQIAHLRVLRANQQWQSFWN